MSSVAQTTDNNPLPPPPLSPRLPYNSIECIESTSTTNLPTPIEYIAIRTGSMISSRGSVEEEGRIFRNCIFSRWDDAKIFIDGPNAEYEIFDNAEDAVKFAFPFRHHPISRLKVKESQEGGRKEQHDGERDDDDDKGVNAIVEDTGEGASTTNVDSLIEEICPSSEGKNNEDPPPEDLLTSLPMRIRTMSETIDSSASMQSCDVEHTIAMVNNESLHAYDSTSATTTSYDAPAISVYDNHNEDQNHTKGRKRKLEKNNDDYPKAGKQKKFTKPSPYDWDQQFLKLKEYYEEHGSENPIKKCPETKILLKWVAQLKRDYKELQIKGHSRLTTSQLQQLMDIGFKFTPRGNYVPWEVRFQQFLEFKRVNGHTRVPITDPTLGAWVKAQRRIYVGLLQNDPKGKVSQDRIKQMKDAGFIFEVIKSRQQSKAQSPKPNVDGRAVPKTWDQRYEELKSFKMQFGHTIVPQHYPQLGWWVHSQRKVGYIQTKIINFFILIFCNDESYP